MYTNHQLPHPGGRGRRTYSPEFKAQRVADCRLPGVSVASVARIHGINHNILHRWLRELPDGAARPWPAASNTPSPAFIELPITKPLSAPTANTDTDCVRVEIHRNGLSLSLSWPTSAAPSCTQWLLELLR